MHFYLSFHLLVLELGWHVIFVLKNQSELNFLRIFTFYRNFVISSFSEIGLMK